MDPKTPSFSQSVSGRYDRYAVLRRVSHRFFKRRNAWHETETPVTWQPRHVSVSECIRAPESHSCHRDGGFVRYCDTLRHWARGYIEILSCSWLKLHFQRFLSAEAVNIREIYNASCERRDARWELRAATLSIGISIAWRTPLRFVLGIGIGIGIASLGVWYRVLAQRIIRPAIRPCRYCMCGLQL